MDKSRQQFEEEFKKRVELPTSDIFKINDDTCEYYYMAPRQAWYWWQASRESLEIELPDASDSDSGCPNYHDGYNTAMGRTYDELISNGVKIKNE
ncbi:hypothetical protein [Providencia alcalifaciens]|uniref:hypothetical protein n=1 Tax=Providencia alcalifaciens TaxID=126385 RepID=UPI001CC4D401|nr:hypothetical protein [Providencia alcalifaciens]CAG9416383.1 hypothetical protein NVI2019_PLFLNFOB_01391 [Providencia alcalifaciens]CAG9420631.1 hypothetical protein NVI2019_OHEONHNH_01930 [Providencia alcalifaciens]CAG9424637.1 hypothetical protein NVI2019_KOLGMIGM_02426 [Providencia alcalifaciens]CAG9425645.1 hypothetical protein NVI2019_OGMBKCAO_02426 [Providencia alcalifaciens]CAG9425928.1 hypothetical protein NVI2019_ANGEOOBF_02425 [Providencia alcalifaciens]